MTHTVYGLCFIARQVLYGLIFRSYLQSPQEVGFFSIVLGIIELNPFLNRYWGNAVYSGWRATIVLFS